MPLKQQKSLCLTPDLQNSKMRPHSQNCNFLKIKRQMAVEFTETRFMSH